MKAMTRKASAAVLALWMSGVRAEFPWEGQRVQVDSTVFEATAYTEARRELTLWFDNGAVYVYREVPASLYAQFLDHPHKGGFFHKHIRGRFTADCRQVSARKPMGRPVQPAASEAPAVCLRAAKGGGS